MIEELERVLIENKCKADKNWISNGIIMVKKECLNKKHLRTIKTQDYPLADELGIDHFKGIPFELPDAVTLYPHHVLGFKIDEVFAVDYKYIKMFYDYFVGNELKFTKTLINDNMAFPALKVYRKIFYGTTGIYGPDYQTHWEYVGLIAGMNLRGQE